MTNEPSQIILHVAAAYGFEVKYIEPLDRWTIKGEGRYKVKFFWDSTQNEDDFFDELRSVFNEEGRESAFKRNK